MKKLLGVMLTFAMLFSFSFGVMAKDITNPNDKDPNQYVIKESLQNFSSGDTLWIGTLDKWKESKAVGDTGTMFVNGEAINGNDIIITNGKVGAVLAVGTRNPWGYPAGSILDAGTVSGSGNAMKGGRDTVWSIEFLVNGWDAWAPDNCGKVTFEVVTYDFDAKKEADTGLSAVKVSRIYDIDDVKFDVVTYYGIAPDENYVRMFDTLTNTSDGAVDTQSNRLSVTNKGDDGGAMYQINANTAIGVYGNTAKNQYNTTVVMPGDNVSSTGDKHAWDKTGGSVGYKELRSNCGFKKDESVVIEDYVIISDEPTTKAANDFLMKYDKVAATTAVSGTVKDAAGNVISDPVIVVEKDGKTHGWYMGAENGTFSFDLPKGDTAKYTAYVERDGFAAGEAENIDTSKAADTLDLTSGAEKVDISFTLKDTEGNPLYGKVDFCGNSVYQATAEGTVTAEIAPGNYTAVVYGEGYWFYSDPVEVKGKTADGNKEVVIDKKYSAPEGWLAGDLHHHANKNDAFADPKDAIPSMLAAGLDVAFVTDHDFTVNNKKAYDLAIKYDMAGFIPSEEISCSWSHFNVIPQDKASYEYFRDDESVNKVMNQFAQLPVFVKETHDKGATITANHPWYSYGLFYANNIDAIPGGYTDDYDNVEINSCCADSENVDVIISTTELWTSFLEGTPAYNDEGKVIYKDINGKEVITEKAHYLVGGSDTHDVLYPGFSGDNHENVRANPSKSPYAQSLGYSTYASGKIRTYAYVDEVADDDVITNGLAFANAVADGNSYTTYGPLLDMNKIPGEIYTGSDYFYLNMGIRSLANIKDILVLTKDADTEYKGASLPAGMYSGEYLKYDKDASRFNVNAKEIDFNAKVAMPEGEYTWVAFVVVDVNGNYAITNPYWVVKEERSSDFSDVNPDAWYAPYVKALASEGAISGYTDGTFRPANQITRAEFASIAAGIAPKSENPKTVTFPDVKSGAWYYNQVMYLAENGYIVGTGNGNFKPDALISRAEIAQILSGICGDLNGTEKVTFSDVKKGYWAYDAIMNLAEAGYVHGMGDGTFHPTTLASRAEAATMVYSAEHDGKILLNQVTE